VSHAETARGAVAPRAPKRDPDRWTRRAFLLPPVAVILLLSVFPLVFSLGLTVTNANLFRREPLQFVGLANWSRLATDGALVQTLVNTAIFVAGAVSLEYVLGLGLAVLLNRGVRGERALRLFFLLPMMVSPIAVGFIIGRMMLGEAFGPVNGLLKLVGLAPIPWLGSEWMARLTLVLVDAWQWTPFMMLLLLAGLQSLPDEPLEAARVDGASEWQVFRHVVFPLLLPVSVTALLLRAVEAFKVVDIIRVVTGGGPGRATESATVYAYDLGVKQGDLAYASTAAYALLVVVVAVSTLLLSLARRVSMRYSE
jgi:multiple sugar transport system permease protein